MITIICIYAKEASYVRKYLKTIKECNIINYMDISNKLTKNDIYSEEPSNLIINSYIIKLLEKLICENEEEIIYYVMSSMERKIICNLKKYINSLVGKNNVTYIARIRNKNNYLELVNLFDSIEELELIKHV